VFYDAHLLPIFEPQNKQTMHPLEPEKWLDNYGDYLYSFARSRINDAETAEDLVQETLLNAWRSKDRFEGRSTEKTWLTSILRNKIIDHYRKTLVKDDDKPGKKETPLSYFDSEGNWLPEAESNDWDALASAQLESKEFFSAFRKCLGYLNGKAHAAFTMKYLDEEESETICKALDISPSNFWVIIHRAKLKMRDCLDTNWFHQ
jgi:RNA polymerase sigma-70 factor (TIGR02943 family)